MSDCMTQEDAMNMDNEQAIQILKPFMNMMRDQNGCPISDAYFALGKAIDALEPKRIRGKWVKLYEGNYKCSECGDWWGSDDNDMVENFHYCPNCGADMRGEQDDGKRSN